MDWKPVLLFVQRPQGSRHPARPQACHDPVFRQMTTKRVDQHGTLPDHGSATLVNISTACCSTDFTATKRIVGRVTASQIASASAASVFPRFT